MNDIKCDNIDIETINRYIDGGHSIIIVGMMGAGKTTIGRKLAFKLQQEFIDTDVEIERAAQLSISEIFALYGEAHFRELEQKIICRLIEERYGVISVGGGAFVNKNLRKAIKENGISIWLKVSLNQLVTRVHKHGHRPLLEQDNPEKVMRKLVEERYPIYEKSNIIIENDNNASEKTTQEIIVKLAQFLKS